MRTVVFDNLVDVKTGEPLEVEVSNEDVGSVERDRFVLRATLGRMGIKKASMESSRQSLAIRNALRRSVSWLLKYTLRFIGTTRTASTPHFVCHRANSLPRTHLLCYDHSPKRVD